MTIAGKDIHFYQVVYPLGILLGIFLSVRRSKKEGQKDDIMLGALVFALVGIIVGSRLLDVIVNFDWYMADISRVFNRQKGIVLYGGYIGAVLGGYGYVRYHKQAFLPIIDIPATYFGLSLALHRSLACFMAGCCYGRPTDLPWGVVFPVGSRAYKAYGSVPVHPTQLYEAALGLFMFFTILAYRRYRKTRAFGELIAMQMAIYGVGRFIIEFFRGDHLRGRLGILSTSQWISLVMIAGSAILFIRAAGQRRLVSEGKLSPDRAI